MKSIERNLSMIVLALVLVITGCSQEPVEIHYGSDQCVHCKMIITDDRFASQLVTTKGKALKFDAIECLTAFADKHGQSMEGARLWVTNFNNPGQWLPADSARYIRSETIKSPMGKSLLSLSGRKEVSKHLNQYPGQKLSWEQVTSL